MSKRKKTALVWTIQITAVVLFLLAWQFFSGNPKSDSHVLVDELFFGKPTGIWDKIVDLYNSGSLWDHIYITTKEALLGFVIGCAAGMFVGVMFGINPFLARVANPLLSALYAVPRLALTPLFIIWFGLGWQSKAALVVTVVFFIVFYSTYAGVREVDNELRDVLRIMDATKVQLHRRVTLPSASVWVVSSLRVAVPYAFVAAVVGELIASSQGLGFLIGRGSSGLNPNATFAAIFLVVILAMILNGIVSLIERRLTRWKIDTNAVPTAL